MAPFIPGVLTIPYILASMAICGAGWGSFQPPNSRAILTSVPISRTGTAAVMAAAGRVIGQATGAALVACFMRLLPEHGRHTAIWWAVSITLGAAIVSIARGGIEPIPGQGANPPDDFTDP